MYPRIARFFGHNGLQHRLCLGDFSFAEPNAGSIYLGCNVIRLELQRGVHISSSLIGLSHGERELSELAHTLEDALAVDVASVQVSLAEVAFTAADVFAGIITALTLLYAGYLSVHHELEVDRFASFLAAMLLAGVVTTEELHLRHERAKTEQAERQFQTAVAITSATLQDVREQPQQIEIPHGR